MNDKQESPATASEDFDTFEDIVVPTETQPPTPSAQEFATEGGPWVRLRRVAGKPVITGVPYRNGRVRCSFPFPANQVTFLVDIDVAMAALGAKFKGETRCFEVTEDSPTKIELK